jgi:hypothetical protein
MNRLRAACRRDDGWTFIEATLAIVLTAIMILGLSIVLMAFREQLDRSWAVRVMDQYGNDVVENLSHDLRNATDIVVGPGPGLTNRIDITYLEPVRKNDLLLTRWSADLRTMRIVRGNDLVDPTFPPNNLGRGENYEIVEFRLIPFGTNTPNAWESDDRNQRARTPEGQKFLSAAWDVRFKIRYVRNAIAKNERQWVVEREYSNRVYARNMNLVAKKGILD